MTYPDRGRVIGTTSVKLVSGILARSCTRFKSFAPAIVWLATTRMCGMACYSTSLPAAPACEPDAVAPAGCGTSAPPFRTPCTAPGTPYSYGPPTTVGTASKLKTGGGDDTCHSSVSARHGFAGARGPPRQLDTTL